MDKKHNKKLEPLAKALRKNMTYEEKKLWYQLLKKRPEKFVKQKIIGKYIVDFYCASLKLVIEVDGLQHSMKINREYDEDRTKYLENYGLTIIRVTNKEINRYFEGVCDKVLHYIEEATLRNMCEKADFTE